MFRPLLTHRRGGRPTRAGPGGAGPEGALNYNWGKSWGGPPYTRGPGKPGPYRSI